MSWILASFADAVLLALSFDPKLVSIIGLSLGVSLASTLCASVLGGALGAAVAVGRFPGRGVLIVLFNAAMGLPPVVAGLIVYLLLSRAGPLGSLGILFTPAAMVIAQVLLITIAAGVNRMPNEPSGPARDSSR